MGESLTDDKRTANRRNARMSAGPKNAAGRKSVSQNARRHGLLSTHLVLENGSRQEFDVLLATLQQEMMPVGLIEQNLVERIAVTIWRQRWLVRAESANVELKQRLFDVKDSLMAATSLGGSVANKCLKDAMSSPHVMPKGDSERNGKLLAQLAELSACRDDLPLATIEEEFPLANRELFWTTDGTLAGLEHQLAEEGIGFNGYVSAIISVVKKQFDKERIKELVNRYRDSAQVSTSVDLIGRYQSTLGNELYKALPAIREAQNWRASCIETGVRRVDVSEPEK